MSEKRVGASGIRQVSRVVGRSGQASKGESGDSAQTWRGGQKVEQTLSEQTDEWV